MSITANWFDVEKTIVRYEFVGAWTWDELESVTAEVQTMSKGISHRVDVIIDFSRSPEEPPHGMLSRLREATLNAAENWGGGVFVGVSPFMKVVLNTFMRVEPELASRYCIAHTTEEARIVIQQRRTLLPENKD